MRIRHSRIINAFTSSRLSHIAQVDIKEADAQIISQNTWNVARECLNDILSPNDRGSPETDTQMPIGEVAGVLTGRMSLSQASAQVRLNWPVIRGCIDRFANRNSPPGGAQAQFLSRIIGKLIAVHGLYNRELGS